MPPEQIVVAPVMEAVRLLVTVTVVVAVPEHEPLETVTL